MNSENKHTHSQAGSIRIRKLRITAALILAGFAILSIMVLLGFNPDFDSDLLLLFRRADDLSDPAGPVWFEQLMRDFTGLGGVGVLTLFTAISVIYLLITRKPETALLMFISIGLGVLVSLLLKWGFARPRPDIVPHGSEVYTSSFPSGHAMMSAIVYLTLAAVLAKTRQKRREKIYIFMVAGVLVFIVGISRVYLGVHWPSDVMAGWLAGSLWAMMFYFIAGFLQDKKVLEPEESRSDVSRVK